MAAANTYVYRGLHKVVYFISELVFAKSKPSKGLQILVRFQIDLSIISTESTFPLFHRYSGAP